MYYHNDSECIYNADNEIRKQNLLRVKVKSCLLCRDLNHDNGKLNLLEDEVIYEKIDNKQEFTDESISGVEIVSFVIENTMLFKHE